MAKAYRCELCNGIIDSSTMICKDCGLNHSQYIKNHSAQLEYDKRSNSPSKVDYTDIASNIMKRNRKRKIENRSNASASYDKPKKSVTRDYNKTSSKKLFPTIVMFIFIILIFNILGVVLRVISNILQHLF